MSSRRQARECALQMLFAIDLTKADAEALTTLFWTELAEEMLDPKTRDFTRDLVLGTIENVSAIDERIRSRAQHWRIERMAIVDRNILRLAVYEFLYESTPRTVVINEALEIARYFSTNESTQFINGILDAIKHDLETDDAATQSA